MFGKTTAYKCSDGKVLTPNKKEKSVAFKARVREYEIEAQILKKMGKYFPADWRGDSSTIANRKVKLKEIVKYRVDLIEVLNENNYTVKI